ncbi:MAG: prolipoprotein diacylglyceryl transferase [Sporichthyaceae bacterium]
MALGFAPSVGEITLLASIPSPSQGVWDLGPFPVRGYAVSILIGIVIAIWLGERRLVARGGQRTMISDVAIWAVPFGILGGRLYHVITTPERYFGSGGDPVEALYIWEGGLGIWGAIALGAAGGYLATRRLNLRWSAVADAVAPGVALAQAAGRWGNWFNQELYGRPTDLPWALEIDSANRPDTTPEIATYHPTFLYESLWCIGVAVLVLCADRRFRLGHGQAFALYVAAYCTGRLWIEALRVDTAEQVLGLRLNIITSVLVFTVAASYLIWSRRRHGSRGSSPYRVPPGSGSALAGAA